MTDANPAKTLHAFACRASGRRLLAISGSVSTSVPIPVVDTLAVTTPHSRLGLVGNGQDAESSDVTVDDVAIALGADGAMIAAGPVRIDLHGDLTIERPGDETLVVQVAHRRRNQQLSGAVDRLVLCILSDSGQ